MPPLLCEFALSSLLLPFFSTASINKNILPRTKLSVFHSLFFLNGVREAPAFLQQSARFSSTKLWDCVPGQGCWSTPVRVWVTLHLWRWSRWLQWQRPVFWSWSFDTSVSVLAAHWVSEIIYVNCTLGLCHMALLTHPQNLLEKYTGWLLWFKMLHVSCRVTNSTVNQWKMRSLYQHTWRQEGIRVLSVIKNV